ncbi:MAG: hypothetical protein WAO02_10735 [Verrucomicrobiia bacterium]
MEEIENILGCYVSITIGDYNDTQKAKDLASEQGELFRSYIWGEKGICDTLKKLKREDYGKDLTLVLFQYYVFLHRRKKRALKVGDEVLISGVLFTGSMLPPDLPVSVGGGRLFP